MATERGGRSRYGNGNSTTGFKDFANRLPAFDQGLLKQCVSFHFVNFPEDWGAKQLFFFMRKAVKAGRLWDIFIPSKRDKRGCRYGFARYLDVRNIQEMKKELGNIWIGNQRVIFNPAVDWLEDKRRLEAKAAEEARRKSSKRTITTEDKRIEVVPRMTYAQCLIQQKGNTNFSDIRKKGPSLTKGKENPRGFSTAMAKPPITGGPVYKKVIELKETNNEEEKLMKCAVGVVLSPFIIPNLSEIFFNEGFPSIKIIPMGGNLVLIDDEDPECIKELVDGKLQWVTTYFDRIKYWSPSDIAEERFVWVRVQGLPLHAWSDGSLTTIGNHVGKLVKIDEYTISKECLDAARILVSTKSKTVINEEFILKVKNERFFIVIVEENWRTNPWWLKKSGILSSESEVSSTDFQFGDDSDGFLGDSLNGLEEEEIQTPFKGVKDINCSDNLCVSKTVAEESKPTNGTMSNQGVGNLREEREREPANGKNSSSSSDQTSDVQMVQETAQNGSPNANKKEAHSGKDSLETDLQEYGGLQESKKPNQSPSLPAEVGTEQTRWVTGTKRGRRKKAKIQPVDFESEASMVSLSDSDIMYNNRRIKEGLIAEEAKKMLDFGGKLGIGTKNREEQILERLRRLEERDMQGLAREPSR
ncbi:hypothetical protein SLA2020_063590 [Shorea laevis]